MIRRTCAPGEVMVDSYPYSLRMKVADVGPIAQRASVFAGYINVCSTDTPALLSESGLDFHPVTLAKAYENGAADEIRWLKAAGLPKGIHVSLDLEGPSTMDKPAETIAQVTEWCKQIADEGYIPSLYVGAPQPLTSDELWKLPARLYWRGQGSIRDRYNKLAEPTRCGFAITQVWPSTPLGSQIVDYNIIGQDYLRRTLIVASQ